MQKIDTFVINLKERTDRLAHIKNEFDGKKEFNVIIVEATKHTNGALGLFDSFKRCVKRSLEENMDFIILCEDDHIFTTAYSYKTLEECISVGQKSGFDLLLGGVSGFRNAIPYNENIFWVESFTGAQFTVVFKKFFEKFLTIELKGWQNIDIEMSNHTDHIFALYPQISFQKTFGYSDVTPKNNSVRIEDYFYKTEHRFQQQLFVRSYYRTLLEKWKSEEADFILPVYVMASKDGGDRKKHINSVFNGKSEFDLTVVEVEKTGADHRDRYQTLLNIVKLAQSREEDLIAVCDDTHTFTEAYDRDILMNAILKAYNLDNRILFGGFLGTTANTVFLDHDLFWVDVCDEPGFMVLFSNVFSSILESPIGEKTSYGQHLSLLTSNKVAIYPMISTYTELQRNKQTLSVYIIDREEVSKRTLAWSTRLYKKNIELGSIE